MTTVPKYVHQCTVRSGPLAGNKIREEVDAWQIEYNSECKNCGEPIATEKQILAHIYQHLTEPEGE